MLAWICHNSIDITTLYIVYIFTNYLLHGWLAKLRTILDQHWKQSNSIHWCYFHLHISHKAAKSMMKLISQLCVVNYSTCTAGCLLIKERWTLFKDHPSTCGCLTSLRNKPQQKQPGKLSAPIATCLNC